ncbi:MAG: CHASE2 domain-containing protein [Paracoccaceae bacterium]
MAGGREIGIVSSRSRSSIVLAALALLLFAVRLAEPEALRRLQTIGFDLAQGVAPAAAAPSRFAVVHIGEESLARVGPWPWRRDRLAALVERIGALGASSVTLTVLLDRPDRFSAPSLGDTLGRALPAAERGRLAEALSALPDTDATLAAALARGPSALATAVRAEPDGGAAKAPVYRLPTRAAIDPAVPEFTGVVAPIAPLHEAARAQGAVNLLPEDDMVLRRAPVFFLVDGVVHPALSVAALVADGRSATLVGGGDGLLGLALDDAFRRTGADGTVWLDFGRRDRIPVLRAGELATAPASALAGRAVVVGLDAVGLSVPWRLAGTGLASGSEVVALVGDALDVGSALSRTGRVERIELGALLFGMILVVVFSPVRAPRAAVLATLGVAGVWLCVVLAARAWFGVVMDLVVPIALWGVLAAAGLALHAGVLWRARRELVAALEGRSVAAEAASRAKTRFLQEMHHDLRTPLNAILGFSSLIETLPDQFFTPERGREYARTVSRSGEHILQLSERALRAAELEGDRSPPRETVDLSETLLDAVRIVLASRKFARRLGTRLEAERLFVSVEPAYLLEAVLNLLDNAFRHGGEAEVTLAVSRPGPGRVAIDVLDRGPGMTAELIARVGTPFLPGRAEHEGVRGAGLGLYIVTSFAERHGGRFSLRNREEGGLRARIELPLVGSAATAPAAAAARERAPEPGRP